MPSKPKITRASSKISPARELAFHFLRELAGSSNSHSDDLLQSPKMEKLSTQDRNLCTALVMGVLRWQLALDAQIAKLLTHKSKLDEPVRIALRLGTFQLLLLDRIPVHAAISDSVELTKRAGHRFASGLVNAVLRKLVIAKDGGPIGISLTAEDAHPAWLRARWQVAFGADATQAICDYDQQPPLATLRMVLSDAEAILEGEDIGVSSGSFLTSARQVVRGNMSGSKAAQAGIVRVQDEGSQLIAELLGSSREVTSILDCCAAPGGKTAILAERHPSAHLVAWDASANRLAKMEERFKSSPWSSRAEYLVGDAALMIAGKTFDFILCDVPCSGTGTLARNPEIKLRLVPEDLPRQQERQIAILTNALRHLAPRGVLVYSTCSLEPEENEEVIKGVLMGSSHLRLVPVEQRILELLKDGILHAQGAAHLQQNALQGNFLRTIPGVSPCDGFFAALLTRD